MSSRVTSLSLIASPTSCSFCAQIFDLVYPSRKCRNTYAISPGVVDMTVAVSQSCLDCLTNFSPAGLPDACISRRCINTSQKRTGLGPRCRLTKCDARNLISGRESIMRPRFRMQSSLSTSHMRFPTRSLERTTKVHGEDEHPCDEGEDPQPLVPLGGRILWGRSVNVRR